jgi:CubicO group peptidase (beta-lactamase class C family)
MTIRFRQHAANPRPHWLAATAALLLFAHPAQAEAPARKAPGAALVTATATQETRFARAFAEADRFVAEHAFPGAVLAVGQHGRLVALKAFGRIDSSPGAPPMPANAIFDLASLTKVAGTTMAAALLYDRGRLDLDAPVIRYLPEFAGTAGHDAITVRHLLTHSSGLKSGDPFWWKARDKPAILAAIHALPVASPPGTTYLYQDFNLILMGEIVERISGRPLDRFLQSEVFGPLGMKDTGFRPPRAKLRRIPPTEQDDTLRHAMVHGVVHDENAYLMGGVAGHAGLFSTAADLARLAQLWLNGGQSGGKRLLKQGTVDLFRRAQHLPPDSRRALVWDMPGTGGGFAGPLASPSAIMHTGFTGTTIYIDPARDAFVILLTNRVNPTRENSLIGQARPAIHGAVLAALDAAEPRP